MSAPYRDRQGRFCRKYAYGMHAWVCDEDGTRHETRDEYDLHAFGHILPNSRPPEWVAAAKKRAASRQVPKVLRIVGLPATMPEDARATGRAATE